MIVLEELTCRFGEKVAVRGVTLTIEAGGFIGVIGRSGAGKSTLLRLINRLVRPSQGRVLFNGEDVMTLDGEALCAWRQTCAMIFQQFNLAPRLDVFTNVMMGRLHHMAGWRSLLKLWPRADRAIVLSALEEFDIAELAGQRAEELSGGQQQRVAIARALVQEPQLILADEPIASLDPHNSKIVMDALLRINKDFGITVLCNLHALDIAKSYCDRLIGLAEGAVVFDGPPAALTLEAVRRLYGLEARDVIDLSQSEPALALASAPALTKEPS